MLAARFGQHPHSKRELGAVGKRQWRVALVMGQGQRLVDGLKIHPVFQPLKLRSESATMSAKLECPHDNEDRLPRSRSSD